MKVVIVGSGRVGSRLAAQLAAEKHDVTLIDRNPNAFVTAQNRGVIPPDFAGRLLMGDGTDTDVLRRADTENSQWFAALTEGDNRNIMSAQIAKVVFHVPTVICRIADPIRGEAYQKIGLQVYSPTILGVQVVKSMLGDEED